MADSANTNRWGAFLQRNGSREDDLNEIRNAPILTETARLNTAILDLTGHKSFPQFGLLGGIGGADNNSDAVHYNVAAPSSIFICGSQGSGKSHTLSCLLENCLLPSPATELPHPLTAIVFHYDTFIADNSGSPCEAAFLSTAPQIKVRVLCAPTNVATIRATYSRFPNIVVEELRISESNLNTKRIMDLMAVKVNGTMPLYMHLVKRVLKELRIQQQATGGGFSYDEFRLRLDAVEMSVAQRSPLDQRLDTLESFMAKKPPVAFRRPNAARPPPAAGIDWQSRPGQLTIVDLSCPTVDPESACQLFNICLSLFLEQDPAAVGRVVALDEAHKYMNASDEAATLTDQLLSTIRLQRHLGARVLISTQEPTVSPKLLDLCSVTLVHRFTSPEWLRALHKHLAGVSTSSRLVALATAGTGTGTGTGAAAGGLATVLATLTMAQPEEESEEVDDEAKEEENDEEEEEKTGGFETKAAAAASSMFAEIVRLRVGEALLFAPNALLDVREGTRPEKLGHGVLKVRVRTRVTEDGGRSVMAG